MTDPASIVHSYPIMATLEKPEQSIAWDLRAAWGLRADVRLTLTERALLRTIVGRVTRVSVTGAFAVVDGWHVPCADVLAVGKPTVEDREAYAAVVAAHAKESAPVVGA